MKYFIFYLNKKIDTIKYWLYRDQANDYLVIQFIINIVDLISNIQ